MSQPGRIIRAARVIHPFPTALNVMATLALAVIAYDAVPPAGVLLRLAAAMFFAQAAVGATNDYFDRDLDARTKPFKPIVRGFIEPRTALLIAGLSSIAAGALTATFGGRAIAVAAVGLAAGIAYDVRLKRTLLSPLPFMVALPALPFWVWLSLGRFSPQLWWLLLFSPLVALAVHLSNTLPDLALDRAAGVRGFAHAIGERASIALAWGSFSLAIALSALLGIAIDYNWLWFLLGALPATLLFAGAVVVYARRPTPMTLQIGFGLIGAATACLAAGWLAAVT
jgi:4-hydroxybenzoate polyprenyltransferase